MGWSSSYTILHCNALHTLFEDANCLMATTRYQTRHEGNITGISMALSSSEPGDKEVNNTVWSRSASCIDHSGPGFQQCLTNCGRIKTRSRPTSNLVLSTRPTYLMSNQPTDKPSLPQETPTSTSTVNPSANWRLWYSWKERSTLCPNYARWCTCTEQ